MLRVRHPWIAGVRVAVWLLGLLLASTVALVPAPVHSVAPSTIRLDWGVRAPMPTPRTDVKVAAAPNGKLYAVGGRNASGIVPTVEEYDPATDTWVSRAPMNVTRLSFGLTVAPNGKLYAVGGGNGGTLGTVEEYDPATNVWTTKVPLPTIRYDLGLAAGRNGKLYAVGGFNGVVLNTVEEYDPATNAWRGAAQGVAQLPAPRARHSFTLATNGKMYAIGGGYTPSTNLVEEYDPATNVWRGAAQGVAQMPTGRTGHAAAAAPNGKLYIVGGSVEGGAVGGSLYEFDPVQNTWRTAAQGLTLMPTARGGLGMATAPDGKLYAIGGITSTAIISTTEAYDPVASTWSAKFVRAALPGTARHRAAAAVAQGRLYIFGGQDGNGFSLKDTWQYTPATNSWEQKADMPLSSFGSGAALADNGKIYLAHGGSPTGASALFYEFTPPVNGVGAGSWRDFPEIPDSYSSFMDIGFAAANNGRLYKAGGWKSPGASYAGVEEYRPTTNLWRDVEEMNATGLAAVHGHGFARAGDGKLYAVGGQNASNAVLTTVGRFTPPATSFTYGSWEGTNVVAQLPEPRGLLGMVGAPNGNLYAIGGFILSGDPSLQHRNEVFEYDPTANAWTRRAPMPTPRRAMSVGVVGSSIFVVGGFNGAPLTLNEEAVLDTLPINVSAGGPYAVTAGGSTQVTANASDPDGDSLTYAWDLDGDLVYETPGQTATLPGSLFTAGESRPIRVRALDSKGGYAVASTITLGIPPSCSPKRPNVGLSTSRPAGGQLLATLTAQPNGTLPTNSLRSILITQIANAAVTVNGSPVSVGQTITFGGGTQQASLLVERRAPGQNPGQHTTVAFTVNDQCGEWKSFVGGGPGAF